MTKERKRKPPASLDMPFEEALGRFIQTDPKEIADAHERMRERQEEVRENVRKRRESIRGDIRPPGKRFSL